MPTLEIRIHGVEATEAHLRRLEHLNLTPEMEHIATYLRDRASGEVFASRGSIIGEPWAPLDSQYAAWKSRHFPGRGINERTGEMRASFTGSASSSEARVRNTARHFKFPQLGTRKMPKRQMLKLDPESRHHVKEIIADKVRRVVHEA